MADRRDRPVRVLLVDDSPETRLVVRTSMQLRGGFEVVGEADCGQDAIELVERLAPDVVVLDLVLPDVSGAEVLTRVQERRPEVKVVIFSGLEPEARPWLEGRAQGYVLKGTALGYLADVVESVGRGPTGTSDEDPATATLHLPQELSSVGEARQFVRHHLGEWGLESLSDAAYLVVSELAANAVTHAQSDYEVSISSTAHAVRLAVRDRGPGSPAPLAPGTAIEHGRGLLLVAAMAASWGVEHDDDGKVVWAELRHKHDTAAAS